VRVTRSGLARRAGPLLFSIVLVAFGSGLSAQAQDFEGLGHVLGDSAAPVEVVEFIDMGCKECRIFSEETFPEVRRRYIESGRIRWRVIPYVSGQPNGREAAVAVECAADQGAFWPMHDMLFEHQQDWFLKMRPQRQFGRYAESLELDEERFGECWDEKSPASRIERHDRVASRAGVRATPTFFIQGRMVLGALPLPQFRQLLDSALGGR